jgi:hypothetical protein
MRCLPLIALAAATAVTTIPAAAVDMPSRKPGLWELKMMFAGRSLPPQVTQHCVDAATDKQMNALGTGASKDKCSKQDVSRAGDKMIVDSVCQLGGGTTTSHAEVTGSFDSAYTIKVTSKMDGAAVPGMPAGAATSMTIDAKWLGACKADQKPGDIVMANGMKMNVFDMQKMQGARGGARPGAMPAR